MSSSHLHASSGGASIFSDDEEHPWGESPHKRASSSASSSSSSSTTSSDVDSSSKNNTTTNQSNKSYAVESVQATTTPSKKPFDGRQNTTAGNANDNTKKPSLAPPMGFTPSPVPISNNNARKQQQQQQQQPSHDQSAAAATTGVPATPELLATIARRLGISPSKKGTPTSSSDHRATTKGANIICNTTNANTNTTDMACRTIASGTLSPPPPPPPPPADLDLSHLMEAHFDEAGEAAGRLAAEAANLRGGGVGGEATAKQALVQDAMKRRFAPTHDDDDDDESGGGDKENASNFGTPAAAGRSNANASHTSHAAVDMIMHMHTPGSVPSVGLSAMLETAPTPPSAAPAAAYTPPNANASSMSASMTSYAYHDIAAPTPATVAGGGGGAGAMTMTIPEDGAVHHGGDMTGTDANHYCNDDDHHGGDVSPSKIRFADMMSICEEGEMTTTLIDEEDNHHLNTSSNRSVLSRGAGDDERVPPASPSVCNGSHDLSAMCDYVMDGSNANIDNGNGRRGGGGGGGGGNNGGRATNDSSFLSTHSAADTVVNMTMARAAVQDESTMYVDCEDGINVNDASVYSEATTTATAHHDGNANNNMIAHDTASELDMRGVSIFNHSTVLPATSASAAATTADGKAGNRADYSYPESTDSSSTSGVGPSGSASLPSAASYDHPPKDDDMDKSHDTAVGFGGFCLKFSREHWFLIATALLCMIGGLVGYGAAFGGWFSTSSSPAASVDSGNMAGEDGPILDVATEDQMGEDEKEGEGSLVTDTIIVPQFETDSPTATPVMTVGDISFQPKPVPRPVPRPGSVAAPPTPRPSPAPVAFRGHETFSFYVIGDVPYTKAEELIVEHQIKNMAVEAVPYLDNEGAQFAVHVGDIMKGGRQADCSKWRYQLIENMYKEHCPIPSFMLPGDNDWYDCPNPSEGWSNWMDSFGSMEVHWDGTTALPSRVQRQPARKENFAFHHGGVLFIGANLVSKEPYDINANYRARMNENREWVRQVVKRYRYNNNPPSSDEDSIRAIFAFGHHRQSQFWRSVQDDIEALDVPLVYFHGNGHSWYAERPFSDWNNVWISQVDMGGIAPPIKVTIQGTTEIARQYPPRKMSPHHVMMGSTIHVDRRGGTIKGPWSTSSFE